MILASCSNCCFNGLQYGAIGLSVGYCTEHNVVLRRSDETTCGRQFRKDLPAPSAEGCQIAHARQFDRDRIVSIRTAADVRAEREFVDPDESLLFTDDVGKAMAEYGLEPTKITSLASLRRLPGVRPEIAWVSQGRVYVRRCITRRGAWTSGLHMLWWLKERLDSDPVVTVADVRLQTRAPMPRQDELMKWSIVMLRLTLIGDIGAQARWSGEPIGEAADFPEEAAAAASTSYRRLRTWVTGRALPTLDRVLPWSRYRQLHSELREGGGN